MQESQARSPSHLFTGKSEQNITTIKPSHWNPQEKMVWHLCVVHNAVHSGTLSSEEKYNTGSTFTDFLILANIIVNKVVENKFVTATCKCTWLGYDKARQEN